MALKQINWGYQFKRNARGPIDPDTVFATYEEMSASTKVYNGAVVTVTDDTNSARNGIYFVSGDDESGIYSFKKGLGSQGGAGLPLLVCSQAEVVDIEYQGTDSTYKITLNSNPFQNLDIIGWSISDDLSAGTYSKVAYVLGDCIYINNGDKVPAIGTTIYHLGSTITPSRQVFSAVYVNSQGVPTWATFVNSSMSSINKKAHTSIAEDSAGVARLYSENVYLKGIFIDESNRNLSQEIDTTNTTLEAGLSDLREEFSFSNLLQNPFFLKTMDGWVTANDATFFKTKLGKWVWTKNLSVSQNGLYSSKRKGAYLSVFDNKNVLSIQEGYVYQPPENISEIISSSEVEYPVLVRVSFMCWVVSGGTMVVELGDNKATYTLSKSSGWTKIQTLLSWDGQSGLKISFTSGTDIFADAKIRAVLLEVDDVETLKEKYKELFAHSTTLVAMAKAQEESQTS